MEHENLHIAVERNTAQVGRLLSELQSEKQTTKEHRKFVYDKLESMDNVLRGSNGQQGLIGRLDKLETASAESQKRSRNYLSVISVIIAAIAMLMNAF